MISPIQYGSSLAYQKGTFSAELNMKGASEQTNFGEKYGESQAKAYTIYDSSFTRDVIY